jgi:two-component system OmpR family sensor kinase
VSASEQSVELSFSMHPSPVVMSADRDRIGQAIRNLVENALVHGAGGAVVRVAAGTRDGRATLAVVDDGPGVDAAELPTLAQRFKRGSGAAGDGAGLGLAIVDLLARRLGAQLVLNSPPRGANTGLDAQLVWPLAAG